LLARLVTLEKKTKAASDIVTNKNCQNIPSTFCWTVVTQNIDQVNLEQDLLTSQCPEMVLEVPGSSVVLPKQPKAFTKSCFI